MGHGFARCTIIVDEVGDPIDYRFDAVNERFEEMTGLRDSVGMSAYDLVPGLEPVWAETYGRVALGGETLTFEEGSEAMGRWFEVFAMPLRSPGTFAIVFTDQTIRRQAQLAVIESADRFRRIGDELPVNVWVHDANGAQVFVNQTYCDYFGVERDEMTEDRWQLLTHPDDGSAYVDDFMNAVAGRRPFVNCVRVRNADGQWRWMESWGIPRFDDNEAYLGHLGASIDVTDRVEAENERNRLLEREHRRRRRAEILERHAAQLAGIATQADIADALIDNLDEAFGSSITAINLRADNEITVIAGRRVDSARVAEHQGTPLDADLPGPIALATNTELRYETRAEILERFAHLAPAVERYDLDTMVAIPLTNQHRDAIGAMVVGTPGERYFDASDLALLRALAQQTGQALERARLYEQLVEAHREQRAVAVRLQRALLPDELVAHPDVEIHANYTAADVALQVGGDWYDTFAWESGEYAVIVGDVVGHDLEAAARMGRLRAATAALIPIGEPRPAEILRALDQCAHGPDGVDFVTAAAIVLDPDKQLLTYACAGHPPAILIHLDGTTELLSGATLGPLGSLVHDEWPEVAVPFEPGATVLMYSDGLVERPGETITDSIDMLAERAAAGRHLSVDSLVDRLIGGSQQATEARDDIIAIAVRTSMR
jgi:PAS domain S-box-containing protein